MVNRLGIEFAQNAETDNFIGRLVYAPSVRPDQTGAELNPYSIMSSRRFGERQAEDIAADLVCETSTARAVLDWRIRWESSTREKVVFDCPLQFLALNPADVVTVTDSDLAWADRLCIVTGVLRTPGPTTELHLVTVPDPIRDSPT